MEKELYFFEMSYSCPCGQEWEMQHDCACNDRCPQCDKENEPVTYRDTRGEKCA